eukprot:TRINITY_DN40380_c0_g1_i1.p1 TRINITY_DN40380_c0_g1~~TRINITY_DN40380_c0_g1_i1.p1  ORF type:complete len:382 (-),score=62.13 TRINITY_DN40380_c0_g1_i1:50-1156(-)
MATSQTKRLFGQIPSLIRQKLLGNATREPSLHRWLRTTSTVEAHGGLSQVQGAMDSRIIGHVEEKKAVLLALIAQEHVYIEGPPGVAKTMLAETASQATGLSFFFYQMHRDTKLHELIGDAVIVREPCPDGGELVRSLTRPGGILTAELCILDDISRAPGEALNVLLRLLNERQYNGPSSGDEVWNLPLRTAIATSNPSDPGSRYYTEPLDPANLDRFVLQLRTDGAISSGRWDEAARIIDLFSDIVEKGAPEEDSESVLSGAAATELRLATEAHARTGVPQNVRKLLLEVLKELVTKHGVSQKNSLLTDRTFLVKALKVMRAHAVLHGREECTSEDIWVLPYMTTFRVPENVHRNIEGIIDGVLKRA